MVVIILLNNVNHRNWSQYVSVGIIPAVIEKKSMIIYENSY